MMVIGDRAVETVSGLHGTLLGERKWIGGIEQWFIKPDIGPGGWFEKSQTIAESIVEELQKARQPMNGPFPERLRYLRVRHGKSTRDLANLAGISHAAIVRIEGGRLPSLATAIAISRALNIELAYLVGGLEE